MDVKSQLLHAQIEQRGSSPTKKSEIVYHTTDNEIQYCDNVGAKAVVTKTGTQTLTNKTIDADSNTITNIENADIKAGAAIALNKLAATTASRALVSDGSGVITPATTTSTEIGYVNGVTSAIQTQIDGKAGLTSSNNFTDHQLIDNGKEIRFHETDANGSHYIAVKAPASVTATATLTLPDGDGDSGQVLSTDGSGVMSWISPLVNPMDAAGQIIYGGASGAATKLAAGTAGRILQTNNTSAPTWVGDVSFNMHRGTAQTGVNPNDSFVKITFNTSVIDTATGIDTTNNRYVVQSGHNGNYIFSSTIFIAGTNVLANKYGLALYKNGSFACYLGSYVFSSAGNSFTIGGSSVIVAAVATDYFEVFFYGAGNNSGSTLSTGATTTTFFSGFRIR